MMKKKKILLGLTALFVSVALCACSGGKNGEGTSAAQVTVRPPQKQKVILFQKEHPDQAEAS